ncbi:MAG: hypothetical protein CMI60_21625 [Parvibaculum sp.]|nr:hypothetical protein [Parvibaculum sp.]|tara:strand:+ start:439 stop:672 length:234 start_codon:yes stop_codon:yes gene_type:complete
MKIKPFVLHEDWLNNLSLDALETLQSAINDGSLEASIYVIENRKQIEDFQKKIGQFSRNIPLSTETSFFSLKQSLKK